ncbi:response regulator transcription factor [Streptomyces mobaraensis NBRC 13819 = DSM 40847]|uniref:Sensory transduction protein RegX3 n=2 Tax=Streptomyces mobaraensis TaxID=35621 RepID=A0A5N5VZM6_STRMB|nr:response regulator transcription factor [Streptomyces mobaraensis]EMF02015.1 putative two component system response regulator [Streptomyces mobaraensis NBRC 13819 = DSM 40847]KAB7834274.1 response regulator transcription factor [Streptomyces mobaraensis]QTT76380.1 response regulator transcription factor [Streptomyces mobaraensis NBRC 13819 = DSM 40847]
MNVLIVEDDDGVAEALERTLVAHGYGTHRVGTGAEALDRLGEEQLVLLDLGLPDLDGFEVCRRMRKASCVPVIALSGRSRELDRVLALHLGADDFVAKPFSRYELVARIEAVLRRAAGCVRHGTAPAAETVPDATAPSATSPGCGSGPGARRAGPDPLEAGPLRVDPRTRKVFVRGQEVRITRKEFDLLLLLMREPGTVMERQEIMSRVWDENWFGSSRTLDVHVRSLRGKLGDRQWIETIRGVGYRLAVPATAQA